MRRRVLSPLLGSEALLTVVFASYAAIVVGLPSPQIGQDAWLALVAGREVWHTGLPAHDVLTAWTHGVRWVDQQWLGQLAFYALASLGGLKLVLLLHGVLASAAFGLALTAARRRGGSQRAVALVGVLALGTLLLVSTTARTQSFAYVLFVAVVWLATADSVRRSRRVLWVAPLLVVWANLHGSVLLGAGLVALSGAIHLGRALTRGSDAAARARHGATLLVIGLAAPFASPYGGALVGYYGRTAFNRGFGELVTEWLAPAASTGTACFYLLGALAVWALSRAGDRLTLFERLVVGVTLAAGLLAIRNMIWFALAATMLVPVIVERPGDRAVRPNAPPWFGGLLASAAIIALVAITVGAALHTPTAYEARFPPGVADAALRAAERDPTSPILADQTYADWLLWRDPALRGRILFDVRFELLTSRQLRGIVLFHGQTGPRWRSVIGRARILVLRSDRAPARELRSSAEVLVAEDHWHPAARGRNLVVLTRSPVATRASG